MPVRLAPGRFYGTRDASWSVAGVVLAQTSYAPRAEVPKHSHHAPYLCLVVTGGYVESCGSRSAACTAGSLVYHPAAAEHADRFGDGGGTCFNIELGPEWNDRLAASGLDGMGWTCFAGIGGSAAAQIRGEAAVQDASSALAIEGHVLLLLAVLGRHERSTAPRGRPPWLRAARERLEETFRAPPTIAVLAHEAGVEPAYLARAFKRHTGCTPGEYVRSIRVERARTLLRGAELSLATIALELGYADQAHFTRQFRAAVGVTPGAFRRDARA